jgi:hypothetical protein
MHSASRDRHRVVERWRVVRGKVSASERLNQLLRQKYGIDPSSHQPAIPIRPVICLRPTPHSPSGDLARAFISPLTESNVNSVRSMQMDFGLTCWANRTRRYTIQSWARSFTGGPKLKILCIGRKSIALHTSQIADYVPFIPVHLLSWCIFSFN